MNDKLVCFKETVFYTPATLFTSAHPIGYSCCMMDKSLWGCCMVVIKDSILD